MNAITFETAVTAEHQFHCELPAHLPVGMRVRVTLEPLEGALEPPSVAQSELGQRLWAIRQQALAKGMKLQSVEEILTEVREGRGEAGDD
jgi:hypothetical protein